MPTDDADALDRAHFLRMAEGEDISRRLARVNARATLQLLEQLERDVDRRDREVDAAAAIAAIAPLLPAALERATAELRDPEEELTLKEAAARLGRSRTQLTRLLREGKSPVPFTMRSQYARFLRRDVDELVGDVPPPPSPGSPLALLVEALKGAMPPASGPALINTKKAATALGLRPSQLLGQITHGVASVRPIRQGRKFYFRVRDVAAAAAKLQTTPSVEGTT